MDPECRRCPRPGMERPVSPRFLPQVNVRLCSTIDLGLPPHDRPGSMSSRRVTMLILGQNGTQWANNSSTTHQHWLYATLAMASFSRRTLTFCLQASNPNLPKNIPALISESLRACDPELRQVLMGNVVLTGGGSLFSGFGDRLGAELSRTFPHVFSMLFLCGLIFQFDSRTGEDPRARKSY
jgi:Actin and related proteins